VPGEKRLSKIQELVREMKVSEAMTREVVTLEPGTPMRQLGEVLRKGRISGTPVVEDGKVVGIVSIEDFINWLGEGGRDVLVRDKMTREVTVVRGEEPLMHAISKLEDLGFGRLPVVEPHEQRLVGIITKGDVVEGLLKKLEIDYHEEEVQRYTGEWLFDDVFADRSGLNLEYHVPGGDVRNAGNCASRLRKTLARLGVHPHALRRIAIATYEAEMNVAIYTDGGEITASVHPQEVVVVVTDSGPGIPDVEEAIRPGFSTAAEWVRELGFGAGMGLDNIRNCANEMKLTSEVGVGTRLEARITLDRSAA
jgi:CBS domain-containing protein/anti-sigma regulatory factor (Ser/Thr protein kinase)